MLAPIPTFCALRTHTCHLMASRLGWPDADDYDDPMENDDDDWSEEAEEADWDEDSAPWAEDGDDTLPPDTAEDVLAWEELDDEEP